MVEPQPPLRVTADTLLQQQSAVCHLTTGLCWNKRSLIVSVRFPKAWWKDLFGLNCVIVIISGLFCSSLESQRLTSWSGRRVDSLSVRRDNAHSKWERKELLIILVTTGGRHTRGFLWEAKASALLALRCVRTPRDRLGPWLSPLVLTGFSVKCEASSSHYSHHNNLGGGGLFPEHRYKQTREGCWRGRVFLTVTLLCCFYSGNKQGCCICSYTQCFSIQVEIRRPPWSFTAFHWVFYRLYISPKVPGQMLFFFCVYINIKYTNPWYIVCVKNNKRGAVNKDIQVETFWMSSLKLEQCKNRFMGGKKSRIIRYFKCYRIFQTISRTSQKIYNEEKKHIQYVVSVLCCKSAL